MIPWFTPLSRVRDHARQAIPAAYDVNVEMINFLSSNASSIDDSAKAIGTTLLSCQSGYQYHHFPEQAAVLVVDLRKRADVQFGYQHKMHRCRRVDIVKSKNVLVFVYFLAGDFAPNDLAEYAVIHLFCFPRRFFVNAGDSFPALQFIQHSLRPHAVVCQ